MEEPPSPSSDSQLIFHFQQDQYMNPSIFVDKIFTRKRVQPTETFDNGVQSLSVEAMLVLREQFHQQHHHFPNDLLINEQPPSIGTMTRVGLNSQTACG